MPRKMKQKLKSIYNNEDNTIGKRIARLRKEKGFTQKELAEKIGINRSLMCDYEIGRIRIYSEMIARIAIALNVSTDNILGVKNIGNNKNIPSLKLIKRMYAIEKLSKSKQKALLKNIDNFLKAEGIK